MNEQEKKNYTDAIQKNLTRACYLKCSKQPKATAQCFEACYQKYLSTLGTVSQTVREIAYEKHSVIGYKGYPEHNIESLGKLDSTLLMNLDEFPFAMQHNNRA